ncbi:MAG: hypothetical protein PHP22_11090 [Oscillospiraceae bacterium]|nr:hypothetical protein [Oscillospiraceae bacterium]
MCKILAVIVMVVFTVSAMGCMPIMKDSLHSGEDTSSEIIFAAGEKSTSVTEEQTETSVSESTPSDDASYEIGDSITEQDYNRIDWNLSAYSTYFCVVSGSAVIHYWGGGETILAYFTNILMYVNAYTGTSLTVDLKTGYTSKGYGSMPIPDFGSTEELAEQPAQMLAYSGIENFEGQEVIVYSTDVEGGNASYFISVPAWKCIGWEFVSGEGTVTYFFNENATFEDVVDSIFESANDSLPEDTDEEPDYHDSDGDGFSDWNEDRMPSLEELEELKDRWRDEGMPQDQYLTSVSELYDRFDWNIGRDNG